MAEAKWSILYRACHWHCIWHWLLWNLWHRAWSSPSLGSSWLSCVTLWHIVFQLWVQKIHVWVVAYLGCFCHTKQSFFSFWIWISYLWMGLVWMLGGVVKENCWQMEVVPEALKRTVLLAGICSGYCLSRVEHAHSPWGRQTGILISQGSKLSLREVMWPTWCHTTKQ